MHETAFARDPDHRVTDADLTRLIPGAVVTGNDAGRHVGRARYVIADAASDRDLDAVVAAVPRIEDVLWVGSPGLAEALARRLAPVAVREPPEPPYGRRVLVVVGSLHPASREQLARFHDDAAAVLVPGLAVRAAEVAARTLAGGRVAVLHGSVEPLPDGVMIEALARVAADLAGRQAFDGLVLTGGRTARTVLLALGTGAIRLTGRPEPGVALGILDHPAPIAVALKAGGFGDPGTLARLTTLLDGNPHLP